MQQQLLIIGGTGFIGRYLVEEALREGYAVSILNRSGKGHYPCNYIKGDLLALKTIDYQTILNGIDKVIFAAGVDERSHAEGEPYAFYERHNITPCAELFAAMRNSAVSHCVILNSIFASLHRQKPELELTKKHAYIRSRVDQNNLCHELANGHFILTTIEVPWVFGLPHNGKSQWHDLIQYARNSSPIICCHGGTSIIAVSALAEACIHALSKPTASSSLAITDSYHSYHDLLSLICEFSGRPNPLIIDMSDAAFADIMSVSGEMAKLFGFKSGLDIEFVPELLRQELRFDNSEALAQLGYSTGLGLPALQSLVENTEENVFAKTWRQTLNSLKV